MNSKDYLDDIIKGSLDSGSDEVIAGCQVTDLEEITYRSGEFNLLRSVAEERTWTNAYIRKAKGGAQSSGIGPDIANQLVRESVEIAKGSEPDEANELAPGNSPRHFQKGPMECDFDLMSRRFVELLDECRDCYPNLHVESATMDFRKSVNSIQNSRGVDFTQAQGSYRVRILVANQKDKTSGSFNHSGVILGTLDRPLIESGSIRRILEQENTVSVMDVLEKSFNGSVIITPDCLLSFLYELTQHLGDYALISGTSILRDQLGNRVASDTFTLSSKPVSEDLVVGSFYSREGFQEENIPVIENGTLKSYHLSLFGSLKTGLERGRSSGGYYVVESGSHRFEELVDGVENGLLLTRFSGSVANTGEFSGVAKNSYRISNGQIGGRIEETMVSGNLLDLFGCISGISEKRVGFGHSILPWIRSEGLSISPALTAS